MAIIKAVSSHAGMSRVLDYVTKKEKTESRLITGIHCSPASVKDEMYMTKKIWGKMGGRTYKHYIQSYHENEYITPEQAHQNALELALETKAWDGFEVLIATHVDRGHVHSHFVVNSVNYENGHKLQWSKKDLQDLKDRSNEQSRRQGLHVAKKGKTFEGEEREETVAWSKETYQLLKKAESQQAQSYVQDIALAILESKETSTSREMFINAMHVRGYDVDWNDNHKYITFTDIDRKERGETKSKIRNHKLEKYYAMDFSKEGLEYEFKENARKQQVIESIRYQLDGDDRTLAEDNRPERETISEFEMFHGRDLTEERLADLRSSGGSGEVESQGRNDETKRWLDHINAQEKSSRAERADREAERERLAIEAGRGYAERGRKPDAEINHNRTKSKRPDLAR